MKLIKKHWSNIVFVVAIILVLNPTTKEWLIKTVAFSPSVDTEKIVLENYRWQLEGLDGEKLDFSDLKGKVVFVNFWATWCPPCRAEMPAIQNLVDKYKDDIAFVFVTQESKEVVLPFMKKYKYDLPVYRSLTEVPNKLNTTNSIPSTYVISKKGEIIINETGAVNWDSKATFKIIENLLNK